jgi:hypothetical protein
MPNPPQGPSQFSAPSEDKHHECSHTEEGYAAAQEVCAHSAVRGVNFDVPLGCGHRRGLAADGAAFLSDRRFSVHDDEFGAISSHIRVTEVRVREQA